MEDLTQTAAWKEMKGLAVQVTNAVLANDHVLEEHFYAEMKRVGQSLLVAFGRDPIVLETLADFTPDFREARLLLEEATQLIDSMGGDSTSPRISLAELIIEHDGTGEQAASLVHGINEAGLSVDDRSRVAAILRDIDAVRNES